MEQIEIKRRFQKCQNERVKERLSAPYMTTVKTGISIHRFPFPCLLRNFSLNSLKVANHRRAQHA